MLIDCAHALKDDDSDQAKAILHTALATTHLMSAGLNVVLRCEAGRNRSAVVAARALIHRGESPQRAIQLVRYARDSSLARSGGALTNQSFVDYLMGLEAN